MATQAKTVEALALTLHGINIGVLLHYQDNKNQLIFNPAYIGRRGNKPVLTVSQLADSAYLEQIQVSAQRVPSLLSNLLPEGALREWMAKALKVDINNEFAMLAYSGSSLTGALKATPIAPEDLPSWADTQGIAVVNIKTPVPDTDGKINGFSFAGVQIKFSGSRKDGRYNLQQSDHDKWIIKTPSTLHPHLPENEYSAMRLAEAVGVVIPEIELIQLNQLDNLPEIKLPEEEYAFAIRRFDRAKAEQETRRIHSEDFAQVFGVYSHAKYERHNHETIGAVLYEYSAKPLADMQQMARRMLANLMIGNGDAHLKNWSLLYPDQMQPVLSPAYDIVATHVYLPNEHTLAFRLGKENDWHRLSLSHFELWASRIGVSWPAIRVHLLDAVANARSEWPRLLDSLPMHNDHKMKLRLHWEKLSSDFKINS